MCTESKVFPAAVPLHFARSSMICTAHPTARITDQDSITGQHINIHSNQTQIWYVRLGEYYVFWVNRGF